MSNSYKHTPYGGDRKTRWKKRQANKKWRNHIDDVEDELPTNMHRKVSESWDICDFSSKMTLKEFRKWMHDKRRGEFDDDDLDDMWYKYYVRK